jgi:prophage regulatory protein
MAKEANLRGSITITGAQADAVQVLRHQHVCKKLQVSSAKLFAMCAEGVFPKPFKIIPGGRAVGWLQADVEAWVLQRRNGDEK